MRVEFDWQVGAEDGATETLVRSGDRRHPRIRWWAWVLVATAATSVLMMLLGVCKWDPATEDRAVVRADVGSGLPGRARLSLPIPEARLARAPLFAAPLSAAPLSAAPLSDSPP